MQGALIAEPCRDRIPVSQEPVINPADDSRPATAAPRANWLRWASIAVVAGGLALGYALGWHENLSLQSLAAHREALQRLAADNPLLAPLGFILFYAVAAAFSFPAVTVLKVAGGFLFGWLAGGFYIIVAATVGGAALFIGARAAFGGFLRDRAGARAARLAAEFESDAFSFFVVSIAPALCNVRLGVYVAATLLGVLPGAFCFAWLGHGLHGVLAGAEASGRKIALSDLVTPEITIALLALTLVAVLVTIVRKVWGPQAP
jgi:uncharacterized membrane protein YdjX (TVP38/TMEM64 family)